MRNSHADRPSDSDSGSPDVADSFTGQRGILRDKARAAGVAGYFGESHGPDCSDAKKRAGAAK